MNHEPFHTIYRIDLEINNNNTINNIYKYYYTAKRLFISSKTS